MPDKILRGYWDCRECGQTHISADHMRCTNINCGYERPGNVDFYEGDAVEVTDPEEIKRAESGEDWTCTWCGAGNSALDTHCHACDNNRYQPNPEPVAPKTGTQQQVLERQQVRTETKRISRWAIGIGLALVLSSSGLWWVFTPTQVPGTVASTHWQRQVVIEQRTPVTEEGWYIPAGGEYLNSRRRVRSYRDSNIVDHYRTSSRRVADGTESYSCTKSMGNGYYKSTICTRPKYKTVTDREPVYKQEPVYDTWYTYQIYRWIPVRTEQAQGEQQPYWPQVTLAPNQRQGRSSQQYTVKVKTPDKSYDLNLPEAAWEDLDPGESVQLEVNKLGGASLK